MSKWKTRPGVTLTEIHGVYLLAADREAREHCSYIRQINELGALIWECLSEEKDREEIICRIRNEYEVPDAFDPGSDIDAFIRELVRNDYLICEEDENEV